MRCLRSLPHALTRDEEGASEVRTRSDGRATQSRIRRATRGRAAHAPGVRRLDVRARAPSDGRAEGFLLFWGGQACGTQTDACACGRGAPGEAWGVLHGRFARAPSRASSRNLEGRALEARGRGVAAVPRGAAFCVQPTRGRRAHASAVKRLDVRARCGRRAKPEARAGRGAGALRRRAAARERAIRARAHVRGVALSALSPQHFTEPNSDGMRPSYGPLKSRIGREGGRGARGGGATPKSWAKIFCITRITRAVIVRRPR